jgi:hypothetical protein
VFVVANGCASILVGGKQTISVNANVEGAEVWIGDEMIGRTPFSAEIKRGKNGPLVVKADGYTPYNFALDKSVEGVFWLNIFIGGLLGSATDSSTGAMYEYEPGTFYAELVPKTASLQLQKNFARRAALRRLVLVNHEPLVRQMAVGEGTHLETIFRALQVQPEERQQQLERWKIAYRNSAATVDFASAVVNDAKI